MKKVKKVYIVGCPMLSKTIHGESCSVDDDNMLHSAVTGPSCAHNIKCLDECIECDCRNTWNTEENLIGDNKCDLIWSASYGVIIYSYSKHAFDVDANDVIEIGDLIYNNGVYTGLICVDKCKCPPGQEFIIAAINDRNL